MEVEALPLIINTTEIQPTSQHYELQSILTAHYVPHHR